MNVVLGILSSALVLITCGCPLLSADQPLTPVSLRVESLEDPLGIDTPQPFLSWKLVSGQPGQKQTAWQVLVAGSRGKLDQGIGELWDSGKIESDRSIHLPYAGKPLASHMECYWKVRVWDAAGKPGAWSESARWRMGLLAPGDWTALWIAAPVSDQNLTVTKATYRTLDGKVAVDVTSAVKKMVARKKPFKVDFKALGGDPAAGIVKELVVEYTKDGEAGTARAKDFEPLVLPVVPGDPAPLFRKEFELATTPSSAVVTVHSPAYFELHVNGAKVGADVMSPAVSNLNHQTFSLSYDVAALLKPGRNCLGLWLGLGWADTIVVRAQLDAVVEGKPIILGTDTSWHTRHSGYYKIGQRQWGDFGGERLDAREWVTGWGAPGHDTSTWRNAVAATPKLGPVRDQPCPVNHLGGEIPAVAVTAIGQGKHVIDFGKALTAWFRLKMPPLKPGTVVRMTFADALPGESLRGPEYQHFNQISEFVSAGGADEVFINKFNYAGFRHVIVEGLPTAPATKDATALLVESKLAEAGLFECSNELFNRIHQVNRWTQRCLNLGGYYVDCPHRERMGYGDGQVAAEGFMSSFDAYGYYRKWLRDWRLRQTPDGNLPHMAPFGEGGGGPGWGGLLSAITWRHYLYYGDRRVLEENYDAIRRYVDYLESTSIDGLLRKSPNKWSFIGDWVPPRRGMDTENWPGPQAAELFNNCYRIQQIELLVRMAEALGHTDDAARYRPLIDKIRPLVHAAFYHPGRQEYVIDEQAYYIMPLMTGVTPEELRPRLLEKLERNILGKNQGHLDTGMLGTYFMMETLRKLGRNDLVFTMFNQTTFPGWGHMLEEGATTFWEQWNGYYSRIHSCFTSPDNWLYQGVAGIQPDPAAPGFKHAIIKPAMVGDLTWAKAHHDSPHGRIASHWQREGDLVTLAVTIPPNTRATVHVPATNAAAVTVNGKPLSEAAHVSLRGVEDGAAVIELESGNYEFRSTRPR